MSGDIKITPPPFGEPMAAANPSIEARRTLALRRSTSPDRMIAPGPDDRILAAILEIAARVPDHRKIVPFRFIVIGADAATRLGAVAAERFRLANPDAPAARAEAEARRFQRAPVLVAVIARIDPAHKTPEWEQTLTCGAVCINMLHAASAYGFAANWLTEWPAYDEAVQSRLGLAAGESIAGFVYIGTAAEAPRERVRPAMGEIISRL